MRGDTEIGTRARKIFLPWNMNSVHILYKQQRSLGGSGNDSMLVRASIYKAWIVFPTIVLIHR